MTKNQLELVNLFDCSLITSASVAALKAALPHVHGSAPNGVLYLL